MNPISDTEYLRKKKKNHRITELSRWEESSRSSTPNFAIQRNSGINRTEKYE